MISQQQGYHAAEVCRILRPGGWFITQQVGGHDVAQLNRALGAPPGRYAGWDLATAAAQLEEVGLAVAERREGHAPATFHDIGAVVLFLRITPWQVPNFDLDRYGHRLRELHGAMSAGSPLEVTCHRFLLTAQR